MNFQLLAEDVKNKRLDHSMTVRNLAEALSVSLDTIWKVEKAKGNLKAEIIEKFVKWVGKDKEYYL